MSDNNVCSICKKEFETDGYCPWQFWHERGWSYSPVEVFEENKRLRAELEKAEKALSSAKLIAWQDRQEYCAERDEARKWAKYFYWMWRLIK